MDRIFIYDTREALIEKAMSAVMELNDKQIEWVLAQLEREDMELATAVG